MSGWKGGEEPDAYGVSRETLQQQQFVAGLGGLRFTYNSQEQMRPLAPYPTVLMPFRVAV